MGNRKWTEGPWVADFERNVDLPATEVCAVYLRVGEDVSIMAPRDISDQRGFGSTVHNANLIAAAPELYEALEDAKKELEEVTLEFMGEDYNSPSLNAALAKARGE